MKVITQRPFAKEWNDFGRDWAFCMNISRQQFEDVMFDCLRADLRSPEEMEKKLLESWDKSCPLDTR